jgi:hypothetical protein
MHFFRDGCVSSVLESSCITYTLRFSALAPGFALPPASMQSSARCFLALTKKLLFLEVPQGLLLQALQIILSMMFACAQQAKYINRNGCHGRQVVFMSPCANADRLIKTKFVAHRPVFNAWF